MRHSVNRMRMLSVLGNKKRRQILTPLFYLTI